MEALVDQEMRDGAIGLSSGLEYEVGSYASTEEVVAMARVAAQARRLLHLAHPRRGGPSMEAMREAIAIGEKAQDPGADHAHQARHRRRVGQGRRGGGHDRGGAQARRGRDRRRLSVSGVELEPEVLVPEQAVDRSGQREGSARRRRRRQERADHALPKYPQYVGKRLDEIAKAEGISEVELYIRIVQDEDAGMIGHTMIAEDLRAFMRQPWAMVASDGGINNNHPRGAGTFPRVLGRFVRDEKWLSLPEAIRKMTSMPAARLKLKDRGTIAVGMKADLMLFDPATIIDQSTFEQPRLRAARHARGVRQRGPVWAGSARPAIALGTCSLRE